MIDNLISDLTIFFKIMNNLIFRDFYRIFMNFL